MTTLAYSGSATGTGSITLVTPATNSNQQLVFPDNSGTLVSTASTAVITPPMLNGAQSGSAPIYGARAWCNFDGTLTGTITPRASGNIASIVKNGTGDYTITFTTAMQDAFYAWSISGHRGDGSGQNGGFSLAYATSSNAYTSVTASSLRIITQGAVGSAGLDWPAVTIVFFR